MSNYNTGNPLGSTDPRDLDDNATNFDKLLLETVPSVPDRLGVSRKTWHQMEQDALALVSPNVQAFAALNGVANRVPYFTGEGALALAVFETVGRTLLAASTQAGQRTALGLGSSAVLNAGTASGVATLGADGKVPVSQIPALAINETFTVASQAAMLSLSAERGDVAIRSDLSGAAYLLTADAPTTLANWVPIQQDLGVALTALRALTPAADRLPYFNGTATAALATFTAKARLFLARTDTAGMRAELSLSASDLVADPETTGGLMYSSVVSGWTVSKYANGDLIMVSPFDPLSSFSASELRVVDVTLPVGVLSSKPSIATTTVTPGSVYDFSVPSSWLPTSTSVRFAIKNGATAQTFSRSIMVIGKWK